MWRVPLALGLLLAVLRPAMAEELPAAVLAPAVAGAERFWQRVQQEPPTGIGSRDLFSHALLLAEAGQHPERFERLFAVARRMQDLDHQSRSYGNFRWTWEQNGVLDANAVEFCMQTGTVLWLRHADRLPAAARAQLLGLMTDSVEGCLRHRVTAAYTNIALMNAANLALLGEILNRADAAEQGYRRLGQVVLRTWEGGIAEYGSPTYYGVDLEDLYAIERFARRESGRQQARALLELFWLDLAANWFAPAQKYGGARSRDYDYLRGLGMLDQAMSVAGWLTGTTGQPPAAVLCRLATWRPPARLTALNEHYPRLVRQAWGTTAGQSRTFYALPDVALGSAGAGYANMDIPLAVDFAGPRRSVRCYAIADGRHDPYGKRKVPAGGGHEKTIHLSPFWTAAQAKRDALSLTVYRDRHLPRDTATLESHWVMPVDNDGLWVGDQRVTLDPAKPLDLPLAPGQPVVVRRGTAAAGVRVVLGRRRDGQPATVHLVADGAKHGACRLTVDHGGPTGTNCQASAAFWVRLGSSLNDSDFTAWRQAFAAAQPRVRADGQGIELAVPGLDGAVEVTAQEPYTVPTGLVPEPCRGVLELDGQELGRPLLEALPVVSAYRAELARLEPLDIPSAGLAWEAETGLVRGNLELGTDEQAGGGKFVWAPGSPGAQGGGDGATIWRLRLAKAGRYYLWGRVLAPTPDDDSFFVQIQQDGRDLVPRSTWATGVQARWTWVPVALAGGPAATPLELPAGVVTLSVLTREDGTKLDRLYLTADAGARPD